MKSTLRDYLTTTVAILVVFACGYGIGHQVGLRPPAMVPSTVPVPNWEASVFERLDSELGLSEAQQESIRGEVAKSAGRIDEIKGGTREAVRRELLELHSRIAPFLDEGQRRRLGKSHEALQQSSH
jgi:hypothetical protein